MFKRVFYVRRRVRVSLAGSAAEYKMYKEAARTLVHRRLPELNQAYDFQYGRVSIRNQRTRWGSCSRQGNLNFHYKLVLLPADLADYVIVHELCHVRELNHSRRFWDLVARTTPDWRNLRRELQGKHYPLKSINTL